MSRMCSIFCITHTSHHGHRLLACTPSPRFLARFMRFVPAVRPACGILRVLRRNNPFVGLAACRRSRVPTRLTFEDGLGEYRLTKGDVHYDVQCTKARKLLYKPPSLNGIGFRRPVRVLKVVHYNPASAERFSIRSRLPAGSLEWSNEDLLHRYGGTGVLSAVSGPRHSRAAGEGPRQKSAWARLN